MASLLLQTRPIRSESVELFQNSRVVPLKARPSKDVRLETYRLYIVSDSHFMVGSKFGTAVRGV
jgi:hypothetical protein